MIPAIVMKPNDKNYEASQKSTRKKWSIQDEPHSLLKRLRSQLAEDGCPDSQLMMGQTLLQLTEGNELENQQQAVYWLIQSSLQGNAEATEELEKCLDSGLGICEKNFQDVKTCLTIDLQVKLAAVAARKVFERLSEGNGFISAKGLALEITSAKGNSSASAESLEEKFGGQRITENSLLTASKEYTEGKLPSLIPHRQLLTSSDGIKLSAAYLFLLQSVLSLFGRLCCIWNLAYVILIGVFVVPLSSLTSEEISFCLVNLIWLSAFICMLYSLASILLLNEHCQLFCLWGRLFHRHCLQIDCSTAESKFNSRYISLFAAYFSTVAVISMFNFMMYRQLLLISLLPFTLTVSLATVSLLRSSKLHAVSLFSFAMSNSPYSLVQFMPSHVANYDLPVYVEGIQQYYGVAEWLTATTAFQLLWILCLLCLYWKSGVLAVALQLAVIPCYNLVGSLICVAIFDKVFITFSLIWVVVLFPKILKYCYRVLPGVSTFVFLFLNNHELPTCYAVSLSLVLFIYVLLFISPKLSYLLNILAVVIPSGMLVYDYSISNVASKLDWVSYQNSCLPRSEASVSLVQTCSSLSGVIVQWEGVIRTVEVSSVTNRMSSFLLMFPVVLQRPLRCLVGSPELPFGLADVEECTISDFNSYTYDINLLMERPFWKLGSSEIRLRAGAHFKQIAELLTSGDYIQFKGMLEGGLGTDLPVLKPFQISCLKCKFQSEINDLTQNVYFSSLIKCITVVRTYILHFSQVGSELVFNFWNPQD